MMLIAGGLDVNNTTLPSAELFDPMSGTFSSTGNLNTDRYYHTATLLDNAMVLLRRL
jgi:hypothetical protein